MKTFFIALVALLFLNVACGSLPGGKMGQKEQPGGPKVDYEDCGCDSFANKKIYSLKVVDGTYSNAGKGLSVKLDGGKFTISVSNEMGIFMGKKVASRDLEFDVIKKID